MAATANIPPDVQEVLRSSTITPTSLILPPGLLPRPLYEAVNKVITNAGGKWNKKAKAHLFTTDPRERLGLALATGKTVNQQQVTQAFYTPKELADELAVLANVFDCTVLEPSAGHGAIAEACANAGAMAVICVEQDPESCAVLAKKGFDYENADFLTWKADYKFQRVVMNPPFTRNQDVIHVQAALKRLLPGGRLVSVMAGNTTRPQFTKLVENLDHQVIPLPPNSFKESGTNVNTVILKIDL